MIDVNKNPSKRELFWFAVILGVFFGGLGALFRWQWDQATVANVLWAIGGAILVIFTAVPAWRTPLYLGWIYLFFPIGWIMSHVVLGVVYYLVLTPIGLLMRLFGRDPMQRKWDPEAATYWVKREPITDPARYFRQF